MCVIVYLPKNIVIEESILRDCHKQNPHSVGYMFARQGELILRKFLHLEEFLRTFHTDRAENVEVDFAIHFRIATSGKIDMENCHPFQVTEDIGLMHNGILSCTPGDVTHSDTNKFRTHLAPFVRKREFWDNDFFWFMVKETVGTYNKLVLMRKDGAAKIVNDKQGTWENGIWFSNTTWKPYVYTGAGTNGKWWGRGNQQAAEAVLCSTCKVRYTYTDDGHCYDCRDKVSKAVKVAPSALEELVTKHGCEYMVYMAPADVVYLKNTKVLTPITKNVGVIDDEGVKYLVFKDDKTTIIPSIQHNLMSAIHFRRISFRTMGFATTKSKVSDNVHT